MNISTRENVSENGTGSSVSIRDVGSDRRIEEEPLSLREILCTGNAPLSPDVRCVKNKNCLNVLSYNVHLKDENKKNRKRMEEIKNRVGSKNYDVVVFNEVYSGPMKLMLFEGFLSGLNLDGNEDKVIKRLARDFSEEISKRANVPEKIIEKAAEGYLDLAKKHPLWDKIKEVSLNMARELQTTGLLEDKYPYKAVTNKVKKNILNQPSGDYILSRWPIEDEESKVFDTRVGVGKNMTTNVSIYDMGVSYARINKNGQKYHVFATHLQHNRGGDPDVNYESIQPVREAQVKEIREFMEKDLGFGVSGGEPEIDEPIIIAGDFNIGSYRDRQDWNSVKKTLYNAKELYQPDPTLGSPDNGRALDHILYANASVKPCMSKNERLLWRAEGWNTTFKINALSDHHPVEGRFVFDT